MRLLVALDGYMFLDGGDGVNKEQRAGFSLWAALYGIIVCALSSLLYIVPTNLQNF